MIDFTATAKNNRYCVTTVTEEKIIPDSHKDEEGAHSLISNLKCESNPFGIFDDRVT